MLNKLSNAISQAHNIAFFTGAGISTDSGIPDFRSANGLYKNKHAEEILSHSFFIKHTKEFYEFYKTKMIYENAKPNYGHLFIAKLQNYKDVSVITQNIDGLHTLAGSKKVYELHGSIYRNYCMQCHKFYSLEDILKQDGIPYCSCGGLIKPDVILYEESLKLDIIENAISAIQKADLMLVLGTSLNVYPANGFIKYFKGNTLAIINKDPTPLDDYFDIAIHDSISQSLKVIASSLKL